MRSFFLFALLASAAVPAKAVGEPDGPEHGRRGHVQADRGVNDEGGQRPASARRDAQPQSQYQGNDGGGARPGWVRGQGGMSGAQAQENAPHRRWQGNAQAAPSTGVQVMRHDPRNGFPRPNADAVRGAVEGPQGQSGFDERLRQYRQTHPRGNVPNMGHEARLTPPPNNSPVRSSFVGHRDNHWSDSWRNDRRYDWSRYRNQHRSLFRFGIYSDPYGFGYNRMMPGWSMWPNYFQSNYWLNDPWMYRLPPAYGPYRWVRYWDDALLVNTYTGQVVDVVYDFFW